MPTYNYYCSDCGTHFSYFQKMSESPILNCENCGEIVTRLITGGTGLIFKGSGFYLTDYKNRKESTDGITNPKQSQKEHSDHDGKSINGDSNSSDTSNETSKKKKENKNR